MPHSKGKSLESHSVKTSWGPGERVILRFHSFLFPRSSYLSPEEENEEERARKNFWRLGVCSRQCCLWQMEARTASGSREVAVAGPTHSGVGSGPGQLGRA